METTNQNNEANNNCDCDCMKNITPGDDEKEPTASGEKETEKGGEKAQPVTAETPSFADKLYEQITSVIGGDNPNQFFCMGLPGTLIDASQYKYDVDNGQPKPPHVKANESKLVNKIFDACKMTASDTGMHLSTQYKTALDSLSPKLNGKLFDAKTKLRKILMTPFPYNFGDGLTDEFTLEQRKALRALIDAVSR